MNHRCSLATLILLACLPSFSPAGTLTADKVLTDELQVQQIGLRPPRANEVLHFSFTNDNGTVVVDDSNNGYDGTAYGCVWTNAGHPSGAMAFDGSNDYVDVGTELDFPSWDAYTVSIWFLHNGGGDYSPGQFGHKLVDKTAWYRDWYLRLWPANGNIELYACQDWNSFMLSANGDFRDNCWHHCAIIRDGAEVEMWMDGALVDSNQNGTSVYSDSPLMIGSSGSPDGQQRKCWSGMADGVRIYDRALSSNEVFRLYTTGSLLASNAPPTAIAVSTNLTIQGGLTVTGRVSFASGVFYSRPLGDLSCGSFTNRP